MKKRVIWKMFLLEIVTLGIYKLYYLIKTRREMMNADPAIKIMSPAVLLVPVLLIIAGFIFLIALSAAGAEHASSNSPNTASTVALLVFYLAFLIAYALFVVWEWSYSQAVEKVTGGKLSFALALVVLVLVPDGIDILIIQDYFNKLPQNSPQPSLQTPIAQT